MIDPKFDSLRIQIDQLRGELKAIKKQFVALVEQLESADAENERLANLLAQSGQPDSVTAIEAHKEILGTRRAKFGYAPGAYAQICWDCGAEHIADKRSIRCYHCADKLIDYADRKYL